MTDTKETLICPACGEFMKKVFIPEHNIWVDICTDGCGGIWFDNREDLKFDEQNENIDLILEELKGKEFKPVDTTKDRYCPVCAVKLVKNFCSAKHQIEIDECYSCGGKFMDRGELEGMRAQYSTEDERIEAVNALAGKLFGAQLAAQDAELNSLKEHNAKSPLAGIRRLFY